MYTHVHECVFLYALWMYSIYFLGGFQHQERCLPSSTMVPNNGVELYRKGKKKVNITHTQDSVHTWGGRPVLFGVWYLVSKYRKWEGKPRSLSFQAGNGVKGT